MTGAVSLRVVLVGLGVGVALTPAVIAGLRRSGTLDVPSARSLHFAPIPRGAGIALIVATAAAALTTGEHSRAGWIVLVAAVVLGAIGIIEDLRGLHPVTRLGLQSATALAAALTFDQGGASSPRHVFQVVAVSGAVIYLCNAVNFMDGINGISAAQAVAGGGCLAIYGRIEHISFLQGGGLALVGAALGFLPFNFPKAKVFLGDSGSYFIGAWLSLLVGAAFIDGLNPFVLLAPLALYLADTSTTMLRRLLRHEPLMQPHRDHAYQRLVSAGWSHTKVSAGVFALVVLHGGLALSLREASLTLQVVGALVVAATIASYLALPSMVAASHPSEDGKSPGTGRSILTRRR